MDEDCGCCSTPVEWLETHGGGYGPCPSLADVVADLLRRPYTSGGDVVMGCTIPPSTYACDGYAWHYEPPKAWTEEEPQPGRCPA